MRLEGEFGHGGHGDEGTLSRCPVQMGRTAQAQAHKAIRHPLECCVASFAASRGKVSVVEGDDTCRAQETIEAPQDPCGPDVTTESNIARQRAVMIAPARATY